MPNPAQSSKKQSGFVADDMAVAKAQKHARFAISALTFDDPDTAVKELRAALQTLGAN
jgi:vacuolar protein sorting-associated protein VTA1